MTTEQQVVVRWPCQHGYHYSHYDSTATRPYTKCEDQHNVTLRRESVFDMDTTKQREVWVVVVPAGEPSFHDYQGASDGQAGPGGARRGQ